MVLQGTTRCEANITFTLAHAAGNLEEHILGRQYGDLLWQVSKQGELVYAVMGYARLWSQGWLVEMFGATQLAAAPCSDSPSPLHPPPHTQDRVRITAEIASALLFLHSSPEPIIHLDLKPVRGGWLLLL